VHWKRRKEIKNASPTHTTKAGRGTNPSRNPTQHEKNAYFHSAQSIIYLGSIITARLHDTADIEARISKACEELVGL
jgi:hypothetical protein